jgi:two-component system sensor histidine kinase NreB
MMDCGMGLSNISSRINSLGGVFDIASAKGRGMRAAIRVNTQEEQASQRLRRRKRK